MISKGCLVRFISEPSVLFLVISDPYEWGGAGWKGPVVTMHDVSRPPCQRVAALDLLELVSQ